MQFTFAKNHWILSTHSKVTSKIVSWPHFSWPTQYATVAMNDFDKSLLSLAALMLMMTVRFVVVVCGQQNEKQQTFTCLLGVRQVR